jgi:hypothetical protein
VCACHVLDWVVFFILHLFYLSSHIALTGYCFVIFDHWPRNSFLVPDSCWTTIRNNNSMLNFFFLWVDTWRILSIIRVYLTCSTATGNKSFIGDFSFIVGILSVTANFYQLPDERISISSLGRVMTSCYS